VSKLDYYRWLADLVLLAHFSFVLFVVLGLLLIWAGYFFHWPFVRNFYLRLAHLLAMGIVLLETLGGVTCPLTTWEARLRWLAGESQRYEGSFIQYWVHRIMFFDATEHTFTLLYLIFFALIALSLWVVRPRWPTRGTLVDEPAKPQRSS
jgi:hypothetical protein